LKDVFIPAGSTAAGEIESILLGCPGVAQVAVIGVPDERLGEVAMVFVVAAPGATPTSESIIAWSRENMANYKVPRRVAIVDALPMNATGKVTKFVLRELAATGP
jgi:acyl-coenzyme A synthetase/AMP-(fatty) acid ligase